MENMVALLLKLLAGTLATVITGFVAHLIKRIERKYDVDIKQSVEDRAESIVRKIVLALNQTLVSGLKKAGTFDQKAAQEVLASAKTEVALILKEEGIWKPECWIETTIEAEIAMWKN